MEKMQVHISMRTKKRLQKKAKASGVSLATYCGDLLELNSSTSEFRRGLRLCKEAIKLTQLNLEHAVSTLISRCDLALSRTHRTQAWIESYTNEIKYELGELSSRVDRVARESEHNSAVVATYLEALLKHHEIQDPMLGDGKVVSIKDAVPRVRIRKAR